MYCVVLIPKNRRVDILRNEIFKLVNQAQYLPFKEKYLSGVYQKFVLMQISKNKQIKKI